MPDDAVVAFDIGVLLRLAGLDVLDGNSMFRRPFHRLFTDVFGAVVDTYGAWLAAPYDDAVKASDDAFGWQREFDLNPQSLAVEIIQHVQQPERTAITQSVGHEVPLSAAYFACACRGSDRPGHVWRIWHGQRFWFVTLQPLSGLDCHPAGYCAAMSREGRRFSSSSQYMR